MCSICELGAAWLTQTVRSWERASRRSSSVGVEDPYSRHVTQRPLMTGVTHLSQIMKIQATRSIKTLGRFSNMGMRAEEK